ncbi:MAG TPA: glycosyltransferase family 2 protein [Gemmatimonadota bacterium]|nr:glycosyltransferase family 2 protein [Gemmatimonadota bacterium]
MTGRSRNGSPREDFSLVVPAYNEAENMAPLFEALAETWRRNGLAGEVILVDDGSADGTAEAAGRAAQGFPSPVRIERHPVNLGKTEAMVTAALATRRRWLVLFDADLQHSADEIPRFLDKLSEGYDVVTGWKQGRYEKRLVSGIYNRLSRWLFRVPVHDLNSMKAFRRDVIDQIPLRHDWHRFFVVLAHDRGYRVGEIPITLYPRRFGASKYSGAGRIVAGTLDLASVKVITTLLQKPLVFFGTLGALLGGSGLVVGLIALYYRFWLGQGYRPLLYLVILLVVLGTLFFALGVLAEGIVQVRDRVEHLERRLGATADRSGTEG